MSSLADLREGDLMFGPIGGFVPGVLPVGLGQVAVMPWKRQLTWRRYWKIRHVGIVTEALHDESPSDNWPTGVINLGSIGQAMPGGFELTPMRAHHWTSQYVYIRPRYESPSQALEVAGHARHMAELRIPYGWLDYGAIPAHRLGVHRFDALISGTDELGYPLRAMCSRAADACLSMAGMQVFDDGRLYGEVTPAELYLRLLELGPARIVRPGVLEWFTPEGAMSPLTFGSIRRSLL